MRRREGGGQKKINKENETRGRNAVEKLAEQRTTPEKGKPTEKRKNSQEVEKWNSTREGGGKPEENRSTLPSSKKR